MRPYSKRCWVIILFTLIHFLTTSVTAQHESRHVIAWNPINQQIVDTDGETVSIYTSTFDFIRQFKLFETSPLEIYRVQISFSPDGTKLAVQLDTSDTPQMLQIWDFATSRKLTEIENIFANVKATWNPDSTQIAAVRMFKEDGFVLYSVTVYDAANGNPISETNANESGYPGQIQWSYDGQSILSLSGLKLYSFDLNTGHINSYGINAVPSLIGYSPDGRYIAYVDVSNQSAVQIFDLDTGTTIHLLPGDTDSIRRLGWGATGILSNYLDGTVQIWQPNTWQLLGAYPAGKVSQLAWSPDGTQLLLVEEAHGVHIRETTTGIILAKLDD